MDALQLRHQLRSTAAKAGRVQPVLCKSAARALEQASVFASERGMPDIKPEKCMLEDVSRQRHGPATLVMNYASSNAMSRSSNKG